jgi:dephospho-CoA kinase
MTTLLPQKLVALTGSIGGGKSAVAELLREHGAAIIDADQIAREVLLPGTLPYNETVALFGPEVVTSEGKIDRRAVASRIFKDPLLKSQLEAILHPRINAEFLSQLTALRAAKEVPIIVYVVPLLFETGRDLSMFDEVIVVATDPDIALERAARRDGVSREDIERRYRSQLPIEDKVARATLVIDNNGSQKDLIRQVSKLWEQLHEAAPRKHE